MILRSVRSAELRLTVINPNYFGVYSKIISQVAGYLKTKTETNTLIQALPKDIAVDGAVASVVVHEEEHGTSDNITKQYENQYQRANHDLEKDPIRKQNQYLKELNEKLNQP